MSFGFGFGFPRRVGAALRAALDFNFLSGLLDPRITFSRTTNATLVGSDGQLQYAPHNLLTYSEQFDNAVWAVTAATISANAVSAPNGTQTADQLVETVGTGTLPRLPIPITLNVGQTYSASVYAKEVPGSSKRYLQVYFNAGFASVPCGANFNLATGTVTYSSGLASTSVQNVGDGWWRCTINTTAVLVAATGFRIALVDNPTQVMSLAWNPDGTGSLYVWGAQLNVGALQPYYSTTVKNLQGYSQEFDDAAWTKTNSTVTANVTAAPDGSMTADKLVEDTAATIGHYVTPSSPGALALGQVVTYSAYAKAAERTFLQLILTGVGPASSNLVAGFDLTTGTAGTPSAGSTSSIVSVASGWYRCSITVPVATAGTPTRQIRVAQNSSSTPSSYTGDGTSGIYIWGAQLSDSASLDPYVYNPAAAPSNTAYYGPRFDYDPVTLEPKGLLIEEQRTNLALNSGDVLSGTGGVVVANQITAPDGSLADFFQEDTSSLEHYAGDRTPSVTAGTTYTWSFYAKLGLTGEARRVCVRTGGQGAGSVIFDLETGGSTVIAPVVSSGISSAGNGWFRCWIVYTATGTGAAVFRQQLAKGTNTVYTGNGTSGLFIWGAQLEVGAFPTSYIPTTTAAATRAADIASVTGANFSNWYNQAEGTTLVEAATLPNVTATVITYAISDGTFNQSIYGNFSSGNSYRGANVLDGGVGQASAIAAFTGLTATNNTKDALAYKANDFAESCNGVATRTDTAGTVPAVNRLYIGSSWAGSGNFLNGHIRSFKYYNTRLSNGQLQAMTS